MSAAAARRRKQLAARQASSGGEEEQLNHGVSLQLKQLLAQDELDEATAYEALQLAQSQVRKKEHAGEFSAACDLAYEASLSLLQKKRVSVASQLLTLLVQILRETHTPESEKWISRITELNQAHHDAMVASGETILGIEAMRLQRLQRDWLRACTSWSSDLGSIKYGNNTFHQLLAEQCWKLSRLVSQEAASSSTEGASQDVAAAATVTTTVAEKEDEVADLQCDAVQHMCLAEKPLLILDWLKSLPAPTDEETRLGHLCPPAVRDALLTRALLLLCALENLRDANLLLRGYIDQVEERNVQELAESYTKKDDGKAPSHVIFGCMLLRICEKDVRTGPLFSWLMRSFKRELDRLYNPVVIHGYSTKIGKIYFNIQPPPSMLNMIENMMSMMGGGGAGGMPALNPAMMQAMARMQQGGMM